MKKIIVLIMPFMFLTAKGNPPDHLDRLLYAFFMVESSYNEFKHKEDEDAVGILQIRPIMVREANRIVKHEKYKISDRRSVEKSVEMFWVVQSYWNPKYDIRKACKVWNPNAGEWYYQRVYKFYNEKPPLQLVKQG